MLLDELLKERTKGRARALFDLWTDALNVTNYGSLLESAFGVTISDDEYESVKTYSQGIRAIARRRIMSHLKSQ
jgi:acyl carrier protein